jgi:hypothetical protein
MFEKVDKKSNYEELKTVLETLYGEEISTEEFIESAIVSRNAQINLICLNEDNIGYIIWLVEVEKEEEEEIKKEIKTLVIEEIVILLDYRDDNTVNQLLLDIDNLANKQSCPNIELTLPSQSFWLIPFFIQNGGYSSSVLRVSKELAKKTEFVQIYNTVNEGIKPELIEVMVSKDDTYSIEIIEEPSDYKKLLEQGYNPEIISMLFYIEDENLENLLKEINAITDWQEFAFSLIKKVMQ